jgi:hypothetical protein
VLAAAFRNQVANPKTGERRSFRGISALLAKGEHVTDGGKPLTATAIKRMVEGRTPTGG